MDSLLQVKHNLINIPSIIGPKIAILRKLVVNVQFPCYDTLGDMVGQVL